MVEEHSYQLRLSRYIHLNPLAGRLVAHLDDYPWSSYPCYVGQRPAPRWLDTTEVYQQLGVRSRHKARYRAFVEMGVDEDIAAFYGKANQKAYLGSDGFRAWAFTQRKLMDEDVSRASLRQFRAGMAEVRGNAF